MKTRFRRIVSLLLVAISLINVVACSGCSKKDRWKISDAEYDSMKTIEVSSSANDGKRYATITAKDTSFKEKIKAKNIRVTTIPIKKETVESMSEEELAAKADEILKEVTADDVEIIANNDNTIAISFKEPDYDYACYYFYYVHKDAVTDKKFAFGMDNVQLENSTTVEAKITTALKNGQENTEIEIKLTGTTAAASIKTEDVTLYGALKDMKVTSVSANGDTITVKTEGKVKTSAAPYAYVQLSALTNDADVLLLAMAEVEHFDAFVNAATFALSDGALRFDIELLGAKPIVTEAELAKLITVDGFTVTGATYFEDQNIVRLFVRSDAANVDAAVNALFGKTLKIDEKAVGCDGMSVELTASCASLGGVIESIEKVNGEQGKFKVKAQLYPRNGSMSELTAEDLSLLGDFEGATVTKVENVGNATNIEFTFTADKDKAAFDGYVEIPQTKLFDMWGAQSANTSAAISYALETGRKYTALENLLDKIGDLSSKNFGSSVSDVISAFMDSGITKFFSGDILGALGSLFSDITPSGTEYEIHCMVSEMKVMMQNLDRDIKELKNSVQAYGDDILAAAQKNTLLALESKWNAFNTNYMERLDRTVTSFNSACRRSLVDFVKSEHGEGLTLYYDKQGKLAVRDKANTFYSVDAKVIDNSKTVTVPLSDTSFKACQEVFEKTGFKYTNDFAIALMTDLGNAVKAMNESGNKALTYTDETGEMLFQYLYQQMMFKNLTSDFMDNMRADFVNFCKQITEGQKVLDSFYEMMSFKYNFQTEALEDMENIRNSLLVTLFNYGATAAFVENYDSASTNNDMSQAMEKAIGYINSHNGLYDEPVDYSYCYAVGRPITLRISDMTYDMRIKYGVHSLSNEWHDSPRAWHYDGYEDIGPRAGYYRSFYADGKTYGAGGFVSPLEKPKRGYHTFDNWSFKGKVTMKSNNILSAKDLGLLKARFNSIKTSGRFPEYNSLSFGDYLTNGKVVKAPDVFMVHLIFDGNYAEGARKIKPTRIATAGYKISDFPVDGSYTLVAYKENLADGMSFSRIQMDYVRGEANRFTYLGLPTTTEEFLERFVHGGSGAFLRGEEYPIGTLGSDVLWANYEVNREYYHIHKEIKQTIYDMTTDTMKIDYPVTQVALYGEHHAMWYSDIGSYFRNKDYGEPYFIFPIG